jgi:uncharacterized protein (DUF58 family)
MNKINITMIRNKWFAFTGGRVLLRLLLVGVAIPTAQTATTVTLTAIVQNQRCSGGDFVNVTLSATLQRPQQNVRFSWDFNNDGVFETAPSPSPTVTHLYPDETNQTATVRVMKGEQEAQLIW